MAVGQRDAIDHMLSGLGIVRQSFSALNAPDHVTGKYMVGVLVHLDRGTSPSHSSGISAEQLHSSGPTVKDSLLMLESIDMLMKGGYIRISGRDGSAPRYAVTEKGRDYIKQVHALSRSLRSRRSA